MTFCRIVSFGMCVFVFICPLLYTPRPHSNTHSSLYISSSSFFSSFFCRTFANKRLTDGVLNYNAAIKRVLILIFLQKKNIYQVLYTQYRWLLKYCDYYYILIQFWCQWWIRPTTLISVFFAPNTFDTGGIEKNRLGRDSSERLLILLLDCLVGFYLIYLIYFYLILFWIKQRFSLFCTARLSCLYLDIEKKKEFATYRMALILVLFLSLSLSWPFGVYSLPCDRLLVFVLYVHVRRRRRRSTLTRCFWKTPSSC